MQIDSDILWCVCVCVFVFVSKVKHVKESASAAIKSVDAAEANIEKNKMKKANIYFSAQRKIYSRTSSGG